MKLRTIRHGGLGLAAAWLLALPLTLSPTAVATQVPAVLAGVGAGVACAVPADNAAERSKNADGRPGLDHDAVSPAVKRTVERQLSITRQARVSGERSGYLGDRIVIRVFVHLVYGKHAREREHTLADVRAAMTQLRTGFAGYESGAAPRSRFTFSIVGVTRSYNDKAFHARPGSRVDNAFKRRQHRGSANDLNIYISNAGGLLGWARFPWQYQNAPLRDGVTIHPKTLPGGRFTRYNQGDTLTHEVGHWMGVFHTFEGGCSLRGDSVSDTPAEQHYFEKYFDGGCPVGEDSCRTRPGLDPIHNYMNYSDDRCMTEFTSGQLKRMDNNWLAYRKGR